MKRTFTTILTTLLVALFMTTGAIAQDSGDYRSTADGDWSVATTWETYNGSDWVTATSSPDGSENITILASDSVSIDVSVTLSGHLTVEGDGSESGGLLDVTSGSLAVADGGIYEHGRDGGSVPQADWQTGSTIVFSGILGDGPDNRDQAFHNITWNNSGQVSNVSLGLGTVTISGTVRVVNTGSNRFRLTDSGSGDGQTITIQGDVLVEGGAIETTGSGSTATYNVVVEGDVVVNDGATFATSRGSGGQATWTIHGDFIAKGEAELRDSHEGNMSRIVFGGSSAQVVSVSETVSYNGSINYTVASGSEVSVASDSTFHFEDDFTLNGSLTLNGELIARDTVFVDGGTMTVADGGTYNHAHDEGEVPNATWADGSTILLTGIETNDPDNLDQDFYNFTWNNEGQIENINIGWNDYTLRGNMTVLSSNGNQFRLSSAGDEGDPARSITIMGNVVVDGENSEFTATGSGDIFDYNITVMGNIEVVNGGFLSVSRGSGGRAVWTLYGDMTINGGEIGDSDIDKHGQTRSFVFAADTASEGVPGQTITANNVSYDSEVYFEVADSSGVLIASGSDFAYEGVFTNYGIVDVDGDATLTFTGESTYNHARDGGDIPTATWAEGSTVMITGTVTSAPGNGNQDFYNIVINAPGNIENNDLGMRDNTINGNIDVISTGDARFYLSNPDSFDSLSINIMGDIYMEAGAFSSNGTGSGETLIEIHHYGSITAEGGNFSISRGSGPIVNWYMYEGNITMNAEKTQNSNARSGSAFIFTGEEIVQTLTVSSETDLSHLPVAVDSGAYLDLGTSSLDESSDIFELRAGGTLASSDSAAFEDNVSSDQYTLSSEAHYVVNGSTAQKTGFNLPLQVASLTIDNEAGVAQSRGITINEYLKLSAGVFDNSIGFTLAEGANIVYDGGSLLIPVDGTGEPLPIPEPPYEVGDNLSYNGSFGEATLGADRADAWKINTSASSSAEIVNDSQDADDRALQLSVAWDGSADGSVTGAANTPLNVVEGETYTFSVWLKADSDTRVATPFLQSGEERRAEADINSVDLSSTYTQWSMVYTATADDEENSMSFGVDVNAEANDGGMIYIDSLAVTKMEAVSNEEPVSEIPNKFALSQNYPNPFNPTTTINYDIPEAADVTLKVYDITGREVAQLVNSQKAPGSYTVEWNAENFATGVYLYRIQAGNFTAVRKLTLIK